MSAAARKTFVNFSTNFRRAFSLSAVGRNEYIVKSTFDDINVTATTLCDRLWQDSSGFMNHVALECAETKKRYTYRQLKTFTETFASSLHTKLGLQAGDVVSAILPNMPEFPVVAFGTFKAGCVLSAINPVYKEFEISHQIALTTPKVIVTIPEVYETLKKAMSDAKLSAKIVIIDNNIASVPEGTIRYSEIAEKDEVDYGILKNITRQLDDVAFIPFSSGTTGLPKGVEITHKNILSESYIMSDRHISYAQLTTETHQDVVPCVLPFFHIYGFIVAMLGHLVQGCKLVTIKKFTTNLYFDVLKDYKASLVYAVPPMMLLLSKHPDVTPEHLQHVRFLCSGAAPLTESDVLPLLEKTKGRAQVCQGYGATETTALTTATPIGVPKDYSACGIPVSNVELKFVGPDGKAVRVGEQGEVYIRGPTVMRGYHRNEAATRESLTDDGFFRTGDLGHFKPGVGLFINDRIKELIKVKGLQVAPAELESLLRTHPSVADAAVIGVPHEYHGETPKAFVILKDGAKAKSEDIQDFVADKVASYKRIGELQFVKEIPKSNTGKILRRELRKIYA